ncbi:MAG: hypothetical protein JW730_08925 [Anaerolineales bacterium]|nr:hypothetical protein [Anaerolineales bacterium]
MNFNFGEVLSRAWQIIWKHKVLWIFGIFAGCGRGGGGGGGGGSSGGGGTGPGGEPFSGLDRTFQEIGQWINDNPWIVVVAVLLFLVILALSIFLGTIGRIGLIKGTYQAEQGAEQLVFGELFSGSMPYFWRVFGLSFLVGLVILVLLILLILVGVFTAGICLIPLICILVPVLWGVAVVIEQANVAIVLEDLGIGDGLRKGWEVVRAHAGPMVLMALILFIGSGVVGVVIALPAMIAMVPFILGAASNNANPVWIGIACCVVYFPILLVLNGVITAYVQTAWALTYLRLTKPQSNAPVILEANA